MNLLIWILVSFGITFVVTHSHLTASLRVWASVNSSLLIKLLGCCMCVGFWVGVGLSLLWQSITGNCILDGFLSSASCWLLYAVSWKLALHDERV